MSVELVIDGYNLLPFTPLGRRSYGPGDLERARDRLLQWLAERLDSARVPRTVVVFDSSTGPADQVRQHRLRGLTVCFSARHQEADEVIERFIQQHATPQRLTVVSSDHRLIKAIRRRKGISITSEAFANQLEAQPRSSFVESDPGQLDEVEKPDPLGQDPAELQQWLDVFSSTQPDEIQASASSPSSSQPPTVRPGVSAEPPVSKVQSRPAEMTPEDVQLLAELEAELQRLLAENEL